MFWFDKGLKLPKPKVPKRYIDSADYLFNPLVKFNVHDQLNEVKRNRFNGKYNDRLKESRELHKKDSSFLVELMNHQKDLNECNKSHKKHKLAEDERDELVDQDIKTANKLRFKSDKEYKDFENSKDVQMEVINDMIEEITKDPLH